MSVESEIAAITAAVDRLRKKIDKPTAEPAPRNRKKLSARDAEHIRQLWKTGNFRIGELADNYDVHHSTIGRIVRGVYWRE